MKLLRRLWAAVVNFLLIILPVVLLSSLLYLYREPIAEQFRDFLGDPVTEAENIVLQIDEQPLSPTRLDELRSFFTQLQAREELSEAERERLRSVIFNLHQSLVSSLSVQPEEEQKEVREGYIHLLSSALIERLFTRHHQVREELGRDWDRVRQVLNLPGHPAQGLNHYLEAAEISHQAVNAYELIYSPRLDCQRLFKVDCDVLFEESVKLAGARVERYFRTLPAPTSGDADSFSEFAQLLPRLITAYSILNDEIAGSLTTAPWERFDDLAEVHLAARERLAGGSRELYATLLEEFEPQVHALADPLAAELETELPALAQIEQTIVENNKAEELLGVTNIEELRASLTEQLGALYYEASLRTHYEQEFEAAQERLEALRKGLASLPGGQLKFESKNQRLAKISQEAELLDKFIKQQDYEGLKTQLIELRENKIADTGRGWEIMVAGFLENNRDIITDVDWQPAENEPRQPYLNLIETVSETATHLELDNFGENWLHETRLALESRRLQQLEADILAILDSPQFSEVTPPLTAKLEELLALDDLPEQLAERPEELLVASIYLEEIRREDSEIYQKFEGKLNRDLAAERNQLNEILNGLQATRAAFNPERLNEAANLLAEWKKHLPDGRLAEAALKRLTTELENILNVYLRSFEHFVAAPEETALDEQRLIEVAERLNRTVIELDEAEILKFHFPASAYKNLLELREDINKLQSVAAEITAGGLLRGDRQFQQFKELTEPDEFAPLPDDYDYRWELEKLPRLHELIKQRASEIHEQTSGQWLRGWGGRLTGKEMLEQWKTYLSRLNETTDIEPLAGFLTEALEECEHLLERWDN